MRGEVGEQRRHTLQDLQLFQCAQSGREFELERLQFAQPAKPHRRQRAQQPSAEQVELLQSGQLPDPLR